MTNTVRLSKMAAGDAHGSTVEVDMPLHSSRRTLCILLTAILGIVLVAQNCLASAFIRGAYYRLGDDDPGAIAGAFGSDPTVDSFADKLDLKRFGSPHYSTDVPLQGPYGDKLSTTFANEGLGGPAFPAVYGRNASLSMIEQGYALEAWVKAGPSLRDSLTNSLIAYNGDPATNGFGLFLHGGDYVARVGEFERTLGPAPIGEWHHLAYIQSLGTISYYYDGKLVADSTTDPIPLPADGGFWLGGLGDPLTNGQFLFNGWIDEVRYQSFNPLSAGAFDPTAFLITPVPEPSTVVLAIAAGLFATAAAMRYAGTP
jgi:Concanavalin A-like lectin/glucanases superfamily